MDKLSSMDKSKCSYGHNSGHTLFDGFMEQEIFHYGVWNYADLFFREIQLSKCKE